MSDVIIVSWVDYSGIKYGLVTNASYPKIVGYGNNLRVARMGKELGAEFVDTLATNYNLDKLDNYEEVGDE